MSTRKVCKIIAGLGVLAAAIGAAYAQGGGCEDSPENPTVVLALLGAASAAAPWLRAKWLSRRRKPAVSGEQAG